MSRRKKVIGICRICGFEGPLSFEHVPPEAAFNNKKGYYEIDVDKIRYTEELILNNDFDGLYRERAIKKKQGGYGFYTLCPTCNNNTGSWYGSSFVEWSWQCMGWLLKANGRPSLYYPTYFYPLQVIKQIVCMMFSVNYDGFRLDHPELVKFLLDKEAMYLSPRYRIYCYYNIEGEHRYSGSIVSSHIGTQGATLLSEITFSPLGFVMTTNNSAMRDKRLTDITHFSRFSYNEFRDYYQKFTTLPTHLPHLPGDYRTKSEIQSAIDSSKKYMANK